MRFTPRPYQMDCIVSGVSFFRNERMSKPKIIVAPTAAGKSIIIAEIAARLNGRVLVLQPSVELLKQNFEKYLLYDLDVSVYSASMKSARLARVTFATIGSIVNVAQIFRDYKYLIIDEAHLYPPSAESMFGKFLTINPQLKVLGLTATPFRLFNQFDGAKLVMMHNRNIYNGYSHIVQIQDIAPNFWSPLEYIESSGDLSLLRSKDTGAEWSDDSLKLYFRTIESQVIHCAKHYEDLNRLIFVPTVEMAQKLSDMRRGSAVVSAKTKPADRFKIIKDFKAGIIREVYNVNVLSVGFDHPMLQCIIDGVPTMSLARDYQKKGRGTRQHPNKEKTIIVDLAGNTSKFGKIEDLELRQTGQAWNVFTGDKQLTNVNLKYLGYGNPAVKKEAVFTDMAIDFGKFAGSKISDAPDWWLTWAFENLGNKKELVDNIKLFFNQRKDQRQ